MSAVLKSAPKPSQNNKGEPKVNSQCLAGLLMKMTVGSAMWPPGFRTNTNINTMSHWFVTMTPPDIADFSAQSTSSAPDLANSQLFAFPWSYPAREDGEKTRHLCALSLLECSGIDLIYFSFWTTRAQLLEQQIGWKKPDDFLWQTQILFLYVLNRETDYSGKTF